MFFSRGTRGMYLVRKRCRHAKRVKPCRFQSEGVQRVVAGLPSYVRGELQHGMTDEAGLNAVVRASDVEGARPSEAACIRQLA